MRRYFPGIIFFFINLINGFPLYSQDFGWQAEIKPVQADGFYNILLRPEINSKLNNSFTDIRIFDNNGKEVPYFLRKKVPAVQSTTFADYEISDKVYIPGGFTEIVLHNPEHKSINNISLIIKNAEVSKKAKLSGSDDRKNWFVVKDNHEFHAINNAGATSEIKILDFPLVNYKYLKLRINDSLSAPINILKAGYFIHFTENAEYTEVRSPLISQVDNNKKKISYITVSFPEPQYIDKLELQLKGPDFYYRKAVAEVKDTLQNGKTYYRQLQSFELSSHKPHTLSFDTEKIKELRVIIENEDNPPLQVVSAQAWQLKRFLTAYLENNNQYSLKFGSTKASAPIYDLSYFQDSIPGNIPLASVDNLSKITIPEITGRIESPAFTKKLAIWSGIGGVVILLGFITIKMVREMSEQ